MSGGHQNTAAWDRGIAAENAFLIHTLMHIFWYHYNLFYIQTYIVLLMKHGILNPLNMVLESLFDSQSTTLSSSKKVSIRYRVLAMYGGRVGRTSAARI